MIETSTAQFIKRIAELKSGDLGRLRQLRGCELHENLDGFDLFTGLWWTLRKNSPRAPRREIAWLVTKLYAQFPFSQEDGLTLPAILGHIYRTLSTQKEKRTFAKRTDAILQAQANQLEHPLSWALQMLALHGYASLDWIQLTDDLSVWHEIVRQRWAEAFLTQSSKDKNKEN